MIQSRYAWCEANVFTPDAMAELEFWDKCLVSYNGQPIWHSPSAVGIVYSGTSYGGCTLLSMGFMQHMGIGHSRRLYIAQLGGNWYM